MTRELVLLVLAQQPFNVSHTWENIANTYTSSNGTLSPSSWVSCDVYSKELSKQRSTPSSVDYRHNKPTDPTWAKSLKPGWKRYREDNFNKVTSGVPCEEDLVNDGWTDMFSELMSLLANSDHPNAKNFTPQDMMQLADFRKMEQVSSASIC